MKNRLTLILPTFQQTISILFFRLFQKTQSFGSREFTTSIRKPRFPKFSKNYFTIAAIVLLMIFSYYLGGTLSKTQSTLAGSATNAGLVKKQVILSKEISFPLKGSKGEEISRVLYKIESAELQDTFIAKGKPWKAVRGRQFLMLTIKITNSYTQGIKINSRDYVRLIVPGQPETLAPDFHNDFRENGEDGLEVQAISTEPTRIGFAVNTNETKFKLQLGEIKGKKETIDLQF